MKKEFSNPHMDIIEFTVEDIVATSNIGTNGNAAVKYLKGEDDTNPYAINQVAVIVL